ncbi:MAG: hypothetical protein R3249_06300 [Nitriliruptorales bacterium]|nr:hypothetical protein [Nitriliruptorales bacterium]
MAAALRLGLVATALAFSAIGLAACDGATATDTPTDSEAPSDPTGEADEPLGMTDNEGRERLAHVLGVTEERAMELASENGWTLRVERRGDETFALTQDHMIGRITVELDSEDDGETWRVTSAKVEVTSGLVMDSVQPS